MQRFIYTSLAIMSLPAAPAFAQPASFRSPIAGFVYSRAARTVRPLLGVPGATYAGTGLLNDVDSASVAPGGKWAWIAKSGRSTFVRGLSEFAPAELATDGVIDAVDRVV